MKPFLTILLFIVIAQNAVSQNNKPKKLANKLNAIDHKWIHTVLQNWDSTCHYDLQQKAGPLPWIIFYDSVYAWHLNPTVSRLPLPAKASYKFLFGGKKYSIYQVPHTNGLWVPGRSALNFSSLPMSTMPFDDNNKTFFIAPLPSFFHKLSSPDQFVYLDLLFLGIACHELTHTLQLPSVLPQLLQIQKKYKLPEHIDDNSIESAFHTNEAYMALFNKEKQHLWNAVLANTMDSCRQELKQALLLTRERKRIFFAGDRLGYDLLDNVSLSLEGSAMWVQYQVTLRNISSTQTKKQTLFWLVPKMASWSQEEGLALFILIDKLVPNWKEQFFGKTLPSPFQLLQDL